MGSNTISFNADLHNTNKSKHLKQLHITESLHYITYTVLHFSSISKLDYNALQPGLP